MCLCPSMSNLSSLSSTLAKNADSKYYQEIGAEMISNQLIIRLEKDKNRQKKKRAEWDPPCDCVEIQRPTSTRGPKIINANCDDRIVFRVQSAFRLNEKKELPYKAQTIGYKVGSCRDEQDSHQCKSITVYPNFVSGSQEVYSNHITEGNQSIFLLRIKKKAEDSEQKNRNVELELRTPKPPTLLPTHKPTPAVAPSQPVADLIVENVHNPNKSEEISFLCIGERPTCSSKNRESYSDLSDVEIHNYFAIFMFVI
ncbi:uncharacterized protein LOC126850564 [Cataglyphis hispanica]|uniref:uncharacterized protein LOC126850564 n=1 Tax=Cataglyphis hispanica TaxID=1086592 RepID=UPI00217FE816|nr:uncharacterized protein LOC126850564 [Cataglyphis hispanica]